MAYTVSTSFDNFYEAINLKGDHRETANARKDDIVSTLKNNFEVLDAFAIGSIPKYTALKTTADLDVMVVLHYSKHVKGKTPSQLLESVQKPLSQWRTNVRKNGQSVTLYYNTWPNVDIVPVSRTVNDDGTVNYYSVPNANDETWIKARPRKYANEIDAKAKECGENFRRIIKMVKQWNLAHSEFLTGYHIEVLALNVLSGQLDDLPWAIFQFFDKSKELLKTYLWHELAQVDGYLSYSDREEAIKRFETAAAKSRDAWYQTYGTNNNHQQAIEIWRQVFGNKFPAYG